MAGESLSRILSSGPQTRGGAQEKIDGTNPLDKDDYRERDTETVKPEPQGVNEKCFATSLGFGVPLLAMIPIGLVTRVELPGLSSMIGDVNAQLQAANTQLQEQLGLFNPEVAVQVDAINKQLAQYGTERQRR